MKGTRKKNEGNKKMLNERIRKKNAWKIRKINERNKKKNEMYIKKIKWKNPKKERIKKKVDENIADCRCFEKKCGEKGRKEDNSLNERVTDKKELCRRKRKERQIWNNRNGYKINKKSVVWRK